MPLPDEMCPDEIGETLTEELVNAIDAASDQGHTTWLTDAGGKRIAKIAPADEIPDSALDPVGNLAARLAAKREETEPVWAAGILEGFQQHYPRLAAWHDQVRAGMVREELPAVTHTLLMAVARQVEEIHRTLGLERDEDGRLVQDRDPLGPPWYGKQAEITARLASGELRLVSRENLADVLRRNGLTVTGAGQADAVWRDLAPGNSDRSEDPALAALREEQVLNPGILGNTLLKAGASVPFSTLRSWTREQRQQAYDWASRESLHDSGSSIARVAEPDHVVLGRNVCEGFGNPCPSPAAWIRTYRCPDGHLTYRRSCDRDDGFITRTQVTTGICGGHENGLMCVLESVLVSRDPAVLP